MPFLFLHFPLLSDMTTFLCKNVSILVSFMLKYLNRPIQEENVMAKISAWNKGISKKKAIPEEPVIEDPLNIETITWGDLTWVNIEDRKSTRLNSSHGYISYA